MSIGPQAMAWEGEPEVRLSRDDLKKGLALAGSLVGLVALLTMALSAPPVVRMARATSFVLLSLPPLLLTLPAWRHWARNLVARPAGHWLAGAGLVAALVPDWLAGGGIGDLMGPALYVAAALLLTWDRPRRAVPRPRDLLLVALLWLPLELRWVSGDFVLLRLYGLNLLLLFYVLQRPILDPGRLVPWRRLEWGWAIGAWLVFLLLAVPIAMASGFAAPGLSERSIGGWALLAVVTFWVIALPEEALFRGVIQELLSRTFGKHGWALFLAALLFGLSHLNNASPVLYDWRYVLLATVAGLAYGLAYLRTGNLAAPVMTHYLVDLTWRGLFAG